MTTTATYTVAGMTCSHCISSVTEEVAKIPGVVDVQIDLSTGAVNVASEGPIHDTAVKDAVEEAGYQLANA